MGSFVCAVFMNYPYIAIIRARSSPGYIRARSLSTSSFLTLHFSVSCCVLSCLTRGAAHLHRTQRCVRMLFHGMSCHVFMFHCFSLFASPRSSGKPIANTTATPTMSISSIYGPPSRFRLTCYYLSCHIAQFDEMP